MRMPSLKQGWRGWATSSTVRADQPPLADDRIRHRDTPRGQVLPERGLAEIAAEFTLPRLHFFIGVGVDRLVGSAVHRSVGLVIAVEVDPAHRDPALDPLLPDRGQRPVRVESGPRAAAPRAR